jgi:hypothetical protein
MREKFGKRFTLFVTNLYYSGFQARKKHFYKIHDTRDTVSDMILITKLLKWLVIRSQYSRGAYGSVMCITIMC